MLVDTVLGVRDQLDHAPTGHGDAGDRVDRDAVTWLSETTNSLIESRRLSSSLVTMGPLVRRRGRGASPSVVSPRPWPTDTFIAIRLNNRAYQQAKRLIGEGRFVADDRDAWSEHRPPAAKENEYLEAHGLSDYGRWYLGVDDSRSPQTKAHYKYPYGDFQNVHRCAVLSAESRAGQYRQDDVKSAVAHLHGMLEGARAGARR